jgi:hypothetical protein
MELNFLGVVFISGEIPEKLKNAPSNGHKRLLITDITITIAKTTATNFFAINTSYLVFLGFISNV